jgi:hypothetical protein
MNEVFSTAGPASGSFFIVAGIVLMIVGAFLSLDVRGLGTKWITLFLPKDSARQAQRARMVKTYKSFYAIGSILGIIMTIEGIVRVS